MRGCAPTTASVRAPPGAHDCKLDNGKTRTFTFGSQPTFRDGDRVKVVDGGKRLALVAN